jgi:hypothetical protein
MAWRSDVPLLDGSAGFLVNSSIVVGFPNLARLAAMVLLQQLKEVLVT